MFNKHAILALTAISTQALKLKQEIVGGDPSTWAPQQTLEADVHYFVPSYPIAGGEGTGTPQQELSVDLDGLAQADAAQDDRWLECWAYGRYCDPDLLDVGLAQVEGESQQGGPPSWVRPSEQGYGSPPPVGPSHFAQVDAEADAEHGFGAAAWARKCHVPNPPAECTDIYDLAQQGGPPSWTRPSQGGSGNAPPVGPTHFAQTDAQAEYDPGYAQTDAEAEYDPGYAQTDAEAEYDPGYAQVDAEADAELEHVWAMVCYHSPNSPQCQ